MTAGTDNSTLEFVLARAADAQDFDRWVSQGRSARWCCQPIRLTGSTTTLDPTSGEVIGRYSTMTEPDGTLMKACGQRRATACPQCAETYRADAWHLIAAGLRGGKGVPRSVVTHPMAFVTLTAPSFGPVHSQRERDGRSRPCRNGSSAPCSHGRPRTCGVTHESGDDQLGQPLCLDCFDYHRAVLWNALATELWRRTTIGISRALASESGMTVAALARSARVSYIKVVEYQQRGVVHLHVVVRVDGPSGPDCPPNITNAVLAQAVRQGARSARVAYPVGAGVPGSAAWGREIDLRPIAMDGLRADAAAAYIAKYATKSADPLGRLDHKLKPSDLASLDLPPHLGRLVSTAWELGGRPDLADLRLRNWAHTLGFRGHWLTKSRRYSTTFAALRGARGNWNRRRTAVTPDIPDAIAIKNWHYIGRGWANSGDSWLAEAAAADLVEQRRLAREDRQRRAGAPSDL